MSDLLERVSLAETQKIVRRRLRANWIVLGILAAFVAGVYVSTFTHFKTETSQGSIDGGSGSPK